VPARDGYLLGIYSAILVVWVIRGLLVYRGRRRLPVLHTGQCSLPEPSPLVSVVVPARNERENIAEVIHTLLAQTYSPLEIVVVDDRSGDGTGELAERLATADERVQVLRVHHLPPGWTGKTHALAYGANRARGSWLLFVDADTRHHPHHVRTLLQYAVGERADLVSILPRLALGSFWERVVQPYAAVLLMTLFRPQKVNDDRWRGHAFANGQCLLIRRDVYDQVGGHAAVRQCFVEDIALARAVKRAGGRVRVVAAPDLMTTRMYTSLSGIVDGWARIFYAATDRRLSALLALMTGICLFSLTAPVGLALASVLAVTGNPAALVGLGLAAVHHLLIVTVMWPMYRLARCAPWTLLFYPLACLVGLRILWQATKLCFTHRVVWRGTAYDVELFQRGGLNGFGNPPSHRGPLCIGESGRFHFEDTLDFDSHVGWQRGSAHRAAHTDACILTENFRHQFGKAIDHLRVVSEIGDAVD